MGGASLGDHYAAVARETGKEVAPAPVLPAALSYLWNHFAMLHRTRGSNGFGPNPISWSEMKAYVEMTGSRLEPWEVEAIRQLDEEFLTSMVEEHQQEQ